MTKEIDIRVIGFLTKIEKDVAGPIPDDYMKGCSDIPQILIDELKVNGWQNRNGTVAWSEDYEPAPVIGDDGQVYLLLSDSDMDDEQRLNRRLHDARVLWMSQFS
jgi:hypothetical protein